MKLYASLAVLLPCAVLVSGCRPRVPAAQNLIVRYSTAMPVEAAGLGNKSEYIAIVRGETETELSFKVAGLLESIGREGASEDWQEGARFRKGDVLATVGGLIPLALTGGELWHPLTSVHIFGLLFATLLTLVLLPVLYYLFCARLKWIK